MSRLLGVNTLRETDGVNMLILPDTQDGTVPHQDRPAHIPRSVCEYKVVCIMLVCSVSPVTTRHRNRESP